MSDEPTDTRTGEELLMQPWPFRCGCGVEIGKAPLIAVAMDAVPKLCRDCGIAWFKIIGRESDAKSVTITFNGWKKQKDS